MECDFARCKHIADLERERDALRAELLRVREVVGALDASLIDSVLGNNPEPVCADYAGSDDA